MWGRGERPRRCRVGSNSRIARVRSHSLLPTPYPAAVDVRQGHASHQLKVPKKDLVTALVARHVDPQRLDNLRRVVVEMGRDELTVGRADFRPLEASEV